MASDIQKNQDQSPVKTREAYKDTLQRTPAVDIFESPEALLVVADLPGVRPDDLDVQVERQTLTIEAGAYQGESGPAFLYHRSFRVPRGIDNDRISAELKDGVLHLTLPLSEALKPRRIHVRGA